jgi:hypothetical protein
MSDERPCLRFVNLEPPAMECSASRTRFEVNSDSLREVLKQFRDHINREHPDKA